MTMLAEWTLIGPARDGLTFNVMRADPSHPLDFRIGRDARGRYAFQLDAAGQEMGGDPESPAGMDVLLDRIENGHSRITLLLRDAEDFEIFRILCADLLEVTRRFRPEDARLALEMMVRRLHQWQEILARRRQALLSRSEIIGLVGELLFMRDLLVPRIGLADAIVAWRGPFGDEQDFVLGNVIYEVKTQGTTSDHRITISSEDQLDTAGSRIVLCLQGIGSSSSGGSEGESLNGIVRELRDAAAGMSSALARLDLNLAAARWHDHTEYDQPWCLVDRTFFEVRDGFPRILRADLRAGVERVKYQIRVADCLPFRVDQEAVLPGAPT